ncbi:MAG: hypothetical protein HYY84_16510 [Deltaproteobacteria bacterium]|nr:hypothetical protein [Deltaproteobacteria bacterium]
MQKCRLHLWLRISCVLVLAACGDTGRGGGKADAGANADAGMESGSGGDAGAASSATPPGDASIRFVSTDAGWPEVSALVVPLTIQEALPQDYRDATVDPWNYALMSGQARANEPVTFGIPIADALGVKEASALRVTGAAAAQFRVIDRWPSGNIRWVLIDTQASLVANALHKSFVLERSASPVDAGAPLAIDLNDRVEINTGTAQFTVSKTRFNLLDSVSVGGQVIVAAGQSPGIELTALDDSVRKAADDTAVQVSIEENGPLRAVVVARGAHGAPSAKFLEYTARLHFYKGKARVRVVYTLRNAMQSPVENAGFQSLALTLQTNLTNITYDVPTQNDGPSLTGALSAGQSLALFHGNNRFPQIQESGFESAPPSRVEGYWVHRAAVALVDAGYPGGFNSGGGFSDFIDLFAAQAKGGDGRAVVVGTRFAAGWWPQGLSVTGTGGVRAEIFPPKNGQPHFIRHSAHITREVLFDFQAVASSRDAAMFAFQYPLVGKATDPEWYNLSGALWEPLVSIAREAAFNADAGVSTASSDRRPYVEIVRHKYWGEGGGFNQYDFGKVRLLNFLKDGSNRAGGYHLYAEERFRYNADHAIVHSDGHDYRSTGRDVTQASYFSNLANAEFIPLDKVIFELEHRHAYGMRTWYNFTGDERFKEVYSDWGEFMLSREPSDDARWIRGMLWNVYNFVDLYRATGSDEFRDAGWSTVKRLVLPSATLPGGGATWGTDWTRGFTVDPEGLFPDGRSAAAFINGAMLVRMFAYLHDFGSKTDWEFDTSLDLVEGATQFASNELWTELGASSGDFGFAYETPIDFAPPVDPRSQADWYQGVREAWETFYFGYLASGDAEFLRRGTLLLRGAGMLGDPRGWYHDYPFRAALQHLVENSAWYGTWRDLAVSAVAVDAGIYRVTWTAPAGAGRVRLKWANRPIVRQLGFNRATRTYAYNPAQFVPFFAAANIADEPTPDDAGVTQSFVVSGVDAGAPSFAGRYYTGRRGRFLGR